MNSPESDDSGGGIGENFRDSNAVFGKSMMGAQSKGYATCPVCKKQLSNQYNLRVHMETHQNMQYSCLVCSHVSRSRDALRKHVSYRHPVEGKELGKNKSRVEKDGCKKGGRADEPTTVAGSDMLEMEEASPSPLNIAQLSVVSP